jgi:hypothetical protein
VPSVRARRAPRALAGALLTAVLALPTAPALAAAAPSPATPTPSPSAPSPSATSPSAPPSPEPVVVQSAPRRSGQVCAGTSGESPVAVRVTALTRAPTSEDEPFRVAGQLLNCGSEALQDLQVRLAVGRRVTTRSELRLADAEPVVGRRRLPGQDADRTSLAPGAGTGFSVEVAVADLRPGERNGVLPLAVQARGRSSDRGSRGPVGLAHTFVPWFPEGPVAPTRIAWVVPLVDRPHRGPGEVMLDDQLDVLLEDDPARRGRLESLLLGARAGAQGACDDLAPEPCRGDPVPVTYAVDPDLVHSAEAMTRPYSVRVAGERTDEPASQNAEQWLRSLRTVAGDGNVLALPYADPDVVALSRTDSPVKDDVELLTRLGQSEARRLLGVEPLPSVAWPPPGPVATAVDPLAAGEGTALLLHESVLVPDAAQDRTPNARKTLPSTLDPVTALVADDALSRLVTTGPESEGWQGPRLAEQRWIAETAIIAAERPSESRTLVVAPARRADVRAEVLAAAVADTGRLPWLCGVPLADVAAGRERCEGVPDDQGPAPADEEAVLLTGAPPTAVLPASFVRDVAEVRRASDQFTDQVLVAGTREAQATKARLLRARGRAESAAWRDSLTQGRRVLGLLADDVAFLRSRIVLVGAPALLTGRVGTVQLVVENGLDQPVNVGVRLDPTSAARLSSEDTALQVVPPRSTQQVSVRVEARTSGRFTARAVLVDASGRPLGPPVEFEVRSTQYGRVALAVTGAAAVVLVCAAGARLVRRVLARAPAPPAAP